MDFEVTKQADGVLISVDSEGADLISDALVELGWKTLETEPDNSPKVLFLSNLGTAIDACQPEEGF